MSTLLSVRKTLVLGLGSTGLQVAEQLAEYLNWQYGNFEHASWVRLLVLETAQPQSPLGDRVLWGGMTKEEYAPYLSSPRTAGADFGFYDWQHSPTLNDINNPSDGAGNCRMLGRLCLFHPRTYDNLRRRVMEDVSSLANLTPQAIADKLGEPGREVKIHEGGTIVYIVGTLCGGTASGGIADLGYLLDIWSNHATRCQAIVTIPHPTLGHALARRYKKNAYYALRELNHFQQPDTVWSQLLPGSNKPFLNPGRPYDILRVVMAGGPAGEDIQRLNAMIAQYLAAAVGPAGFEIAASDVDAFGKMESSESIGFMRPLFSTMGVAALEYPGEHIQRAATCQLLARTYARWCAYQTTGVEFQNAKRLLGGDFADLLQKLTEEASRTNHTAIQQAFYPEREVGLPKVEQVRHLLSELDGRLAALEIPSGGAATAPPTLLTVIEENHRRFLQTIQTEVTRCVDQALFQLDGGPGLAAEALRAFLQDMESWAQSAQEMLPRCQQNARSLRDMLEQRIQAVEQIQSTFAWNKQTKLRNGWQGIPERVETYLSAEIKAQTITHLQRREIVQSMVAQYKQASLPLIRRLDQMQAAFNQEAASLERQARALAALSPSVNGKIYFEAEPPAARGTVTDEYYTLLSQQRWPAEQGIGWDETKKEEAAMRAVLGCLAVLREELNRDEGRSTFDKRPGVNAARDMIPAAILQATEAQARSFFTPLREQVHIADKASDPDIDAVVQSSEPRLGVSHTQVSDHLAGTRGVTPMLSYLAFMQTSSQGTGIPPSVQRVARRVQTSMELRRHGVIDNGDPFRLLIIREKHGFTMGQMESVVRANAYDNNALQSAEDDMDFKFWYTRRDVEWLDPLTRPQDVQRVEETWLLALLLGHPADLGLPWLPATTFEIPSEGWYQLTAGEFYVYYKEGPEVTARGAMLPLKFTMAVTKLLSASPDYALLRRTLDMRFSGFCHQKAQQANITQVIETLDQALGSLEVYGVRDLEVKRAEQILRRAYRRNDRLTHAFFEYKTADLRGHINVADFAHLRRLQGSPKEEGSGIYANDGYYCPTCHSWLGGDVQKLLERQFYCPACNSGERYWP